MLPTQRRTRGSYRSAFMMARHVLSATGRTIEAGAAAANTLLLRTPEMVEAGVRNVLHEGLVGVARVYKRVLGIEKGARHFLAGERNVFPDPGQPSSQAHVFRLA